ncbi:protein of unknown function [Hyphomicrobium sp. MC1]|nr:protein of unknown function [Hyphomicrobium sp. MC1]
MQFLPQIRIGTITNDTIYAKHLRSSFIAGRDLAPLN